MRVALLAVLALAGCPQQQPDGACDEDVECNEGHVCARGDHFCVEPDEVRTTRTEWTLNGQPPSAATCQGFALFIQFQSSDNDDDFGFSPVPCETGVFSVDKLPVRYRAVEVGFEGGSTSDRASFDTDGNAFIDLVF